MATWPNSCPYAWAILRASAGLERPENRVMGFPLGDVNMIPRQACTLSDMRTVNASYSLGVSLKQMNLWLSYQNDLRPICPRDFLQEIPVFAIHCRLNNTRFKFNIPLIHYHSFFGLCMDCMIGRKGGLQRNLSLYIFLVVNELKRMLISTNIQPRYVSFRKTKHYLEAKNA